jgi:mRNA interferase RelE/StbE
MKYQVETAPCAEKALCKIEAKFAIKIRERIRSLGEEPRHRGAIKLSGEKNVYRIRVGDYRILYEIHDSRVLILVVNIGHRRDIYETI